MYVIVTSEGWNKLYSIDVDGEISGQRHKAARKVAFRHFYKRPEVDQDEVDANTESFNNVEKVSSEAVKILLSHLQPKDQT